MWLFNIITRVILHVAAFMNYCCSFCFLGIFGDLIFLMMAIKAEPKFIVVKLDILEFC